MGPVLGQILPFAIGVAISPVPIIAVILMLFSARARQNGPAFLVGWVVGLSAVVIIVLAVSNTAGASSGPSTVVGVIEAGLGVLLVALGVKQWRGRPGPGESGTLPGWMASIDTLKPGRALLFGLVLSGVNPKNLTLAIGAALAMSQGALDSGQTAIAVIVFVVLGSLTILVPVLYSLLGGESARATLDGWKTWLGENNATVMAVLLFVIGMVLLGKGAGAVIG
jgi:hypothetical protein